MASNWLGSDFGSDLDMAMDWADLASRSLWVALASSGVVCGHAGGFRACDR